MRSKAWIVGLVVLLAGFVGTSAAQALPKAAGDLLLQPKGALSKTKKNPVNLTLTVKVTPDPGALKLEPLNSVSLDFPAGLALESHPNKTPVCPTSKIGPDKANFPPSTARGLCPHSIVGDGTADLFVGQATSAPVGDAVLTLFNGGTDKAGNTIVVIHGYSASLNQGIYMSGVVKGGHLLVNIPRLALDSSVSGFQINIPGHIGQDPNYAEASCPTGNWHSSATLVLADRDSAGNLSNKQTLAPATSDHKCSASGGGGHSGHSAKLRLSVKGPKKVKAGHKATFKVKLKNKGKSAAKGVKVKASGGGKGSAKAGTIKGGKSRTVKVKVKVHGKKGKTVTVKFKATGGGSGSGKAKVKVG